MLALTRKSLWARKVKEDQFRTMAKSLQTGDIILLRTKFHPLSWFIRTMSKSYWNHTAIVLTTFELLPGYQSVLVAEALDHGIEIHRIQKFFDNGTYDIGVKRFPRLTQEDRYNIMGYVLSQVDTPYAWRRLSGALFSILLGRFYRAATYIDRRTYTCSNFVQKTFYFSLPEDRRSEAIFLREDWGKSVEIIMPADIANSTNTEWVFNKH